MPISLALCLENQGFKVIIANKASLGYVRPPTYQNKTASKQTKQKKERKPNKNPSTRVKQDAR